MSVRSKKRLSFLVLWASLVSVAAITPRPAGGQQSASNWRRQNSKLVASGKVTAFDGNGAAPKIAKELIKQIQSARSQR
jgi:hypothetical protein